MAASILIAGLFAALALASPAPKIDAAGQFHRRHEATETIAPSSQPTATIASEDYSLRSTAVSAFFEVIPTTFGSDSAVPWSSPPPQPTATLVEGALPNDSPEPVTGTYTGTPTTIGAKQRGPAALSIPALPPNPTATYLNTNGELTEEEPAPYTPRGGLGTNGTLPRYMVNSDFDFESIALGLYQEWIELGLVDFTEADYNRAGLTAEDRSLIQFFAQQEAGHATLLSNMLGPAAPGPCVYDFPYTTVREFVDFNQRLTRWGESGVWGFINHLDSRETAQLLSQSIATEARQQMAFRQMSGLHPVSVWFEAGIPQSWSWTYLAQYIAYCPANTTRLAWQNFPTLHIINNANINRISPNDTIPYEVPGRRIADPSSSGIAFNESCVNVNVTGYGCGPAITRNRTEPLSFPGKRIDLEWEAPGLAVGPNNSYVTSTSAGPPQWVMWVNQLNATYTPLTLITNSTGFSFQPNGTVYETDPLVNDTMFIALTDTDLYVTPFNLSMVNPHVVALGLYQAG